MVSTLLCHFGMAAKECNPSLKHCEKRVNGQLVACVQEIIKTACMQDDSGTGLPPKLREAIVIMLSAAPKDSELVRDVLIALQHGLEVACNACLLPELILRLLQLPHVCQVSLPHEP